MNNLPPLPLVDGCLFVDNSMIELLTTCPRALEYSKLRRRIGSGQKPSLTFGSAIHLALELRYSRHGNAMPDVLEESDICLELANFYEKPENVPPEDDWRTLNWAIEVFKKYNQRYKVEPFNLLADKDGKPLVELPFVLELCTINGIRVMYTGRIDLPVMWDDQIIVMDHKTTSVLGDYFFKEQRVSPQLIGYCWAFEQLTSRKVDGFAVNAIRSKQAPQKPNGGFERWWEESLSRHKEYVFPHTISEWHSNVIQLLEELMWHHSRDYMPMKRKWCIGKFGECPYYSVCDLPPNQRGLMLESTLFVENTWSPLKDPNQSLQ